MAVSTIYTGGLHMLSKVISLFIDLYYSLSLFLTLLQTHPPTPTHPHPPTHTTINYTWILITTFYMDSE